VIPLLLYLRDGWGWRNIAPSVANHVGRLAQIDRQSMHARRIRDLADLEDLAAQPGSIDEPARTGAVLEARKYMLSSLLYGSPLEDSSMGPYLGLLLDEFGKTTSRSVGEPMTDVEQRALEDTRREWGLAQHELDSWLLTIDEATADRGRKWLRRGVVLLRPLAAEWQLGSSSNPLSCFGKPKAEVRTEFRRETGRPTLAAVLSGWLAQSIFAAELARRAGIEMVE
jgi:hypothetical protein